MGWHRTWHPGAPAAMLQCSLQWAEVQLSPLKKGEVTAMGTEKDSQDKETTVSVSGRRRDTWLSKRRMKWDKEG